MKVLILAGAALAATLAATPLMAAPAPEGVKVDLARQIYQLSGGEQAARAQMATLFDSANKLVAGSLPPDAARLSQAINRDLQQELISLVPGIIDSGVHAYADNLTEQELRDYVAWLSSESGRGVVQKLPAVRAEILALEMPAMKAMFPEMGHRIVNHVCVELNCSTHERQLAAAAMAKALPSQAS